MMEVDGIIQAVVAATWFRPPAEPVLLFLADWRSVRHAPR